MMQNFANVHDYLPKISRQSYEITLSSTLGFNILPSPKIPPKKSLQQNPKKKNPEKFPNKFPKKSKKKSKKFPNNFSKNS